jgi:hypothetical protein
MTGERSKRAAGRFPQKDASAIPSRCVMLCRGRIEVPYSRLRRRRARRGRASRALLVPPTRASLRVTGRETSCPGDCTRIPLGIPSRSTEDRAGRRLGRIGRSAPENRNPQVRGSPRAGRRSIQAPLGPSEKMRSTAVRGLRTCRKSHPRHTRRLRLGTRPRSRRIRSHCSGWARRSSRSCKLLPDSTVAPGPRTPQCNGHRRCT